MSGSDLDAHLIVVILLVLSIPACSVFFEPGQGASQVEADGLVGHWVHAYEEDAEAGGSHVFRRAGSREFPPSWFRMQYVFHADGTCEWLYLAPNDAHQLRPGRWQLDPSDRNVLRVEEGDRTETFRILAVTDDLLRLEPLS